MKSGLRMALFILLGGLCSACFDPDDFNTDRLADSGIGYDIAMPLTESRLTIENLIDLQGGLFVPDESGLLHIIYGMEPITARLIEDVEMGETSSFGFSSSGIPYLSRDTTLAFPFTDTLEVDVSGIPEGTVLKELHLSSAHLAMSLSNSFIFPLSIDLTLTNILDATGHPVSLAEQINPVSANEREIPLNRVRMLVGESGRPSVIVSGNAKVRMKRVPGDTLLHFGAFGMEAKIDRMKFQRMDGYMGRIPYILQGEMSIAGLGLERMRNINFEQAEIIADMKVDGLSAPLRIENSDVRLLNKNDYVSLPLFPANYNVAYPDINAYPLRKTSRQDTSMKAFLVDGPQAVSFEIKGSVNPDRDRQVLQAIENGGNVSIGLSCDLPVWFSAEQYALRDTLAISLEQIGENTSLTYFEIRTIVKNAFPLDMVLSLHFLDSGYNELFTMFHEQLAKGGKVGPEPELRVEEPVISNFEDHLNTEQLAKAKPLRYIVVDAKISTPDARTVKIYMTSEDESFLDIKVGVRVKINQKGIFNQKDEG